MLLTLCFFLFKMRLFHNATFFGSCVIHILYTVCAKIKKKKIPRQRVNCTITAAHTSQELLVAVLYKILTDICQ